MPNGTVALRSNAAKIEFTNDRKSLIDSVSKRIASAVASLLQAAGLALFWRMKAEPDLVAVKKAYEAGETDKTELREQGFLYVSGADRVEITSGRADVESADP